MAQVYPDCSFGIEVITPAEDATNGKYYRTGTEEKDGSPIYTHAYHQNLQLKKSQEKASTLVIEEKKSTGICSYEIETYHECTVTLGGEHWYHFLYPGEHLGKSAIGYGEDMLSWHGGLDYAANTPTLTYFDPAADLQVTSGCDVDEYQESGKCKCPCDSGKWKLYVGIGLCGFCIVGLAVGLIVAATLEWGDSTRSENWTAATCYVAGVESTRTTCDSGSCVVLASSACGCGIGGITNTCDGLACARRRYSSRRRNTVRRRTNIATETACSRRRGGHCTSGSQKTVSVQVTSSSFSGTWIGAKCPEELPEKHDPSGWLNARIGTSVACWYNPSGDSIEYPYDANVRLEETSNCDEATPKMVVVTLLAVFLSIFVVGALCGLGCFFLAKKG